MENTINFGIDLGTTNSAIAKYSEGEIEVFRNPLNLKQTLPSVIAFRKNRIVIGDKARELLQKDPLNVVGGFKRKMGTSDKYFIESTMESLSSEQLSAYILKELKNFVHTGETVEAAVITIPASFDTMQSNATKKAGYEAGFQQVTLLQEPIAASLAFANKGNKDLNDQSWLVYDLGGGTFDVALVSIADDEMKVIDHEGDNYLGGTDFDKAIVEKIIIPHLELEGTFDNLEKQMKSASGRYNRLYNVLLFKAEEAKIQLTNSQTAEIEFETEDDTGEEIEVYLTINRDHLNMVLKPYVDRTIGMIENVLSRNDIRIEDIEFALMIGGSTYIPTVREQIAAQLGVEVNCDIDPTTAVVIGAGYFAGMKMKNLAPPKQEKKERNSSSTANELNIRTAFSKVSQDQETPFIAEIKGDINNKFFRILRLDGGFDSGLKPLKPALTEYLPLVPNVFNQFSFKIYDELNNPIPTEVPPIGITHGKFSIDGQPLPNDICLEVDAIEEGTTFLEPIFKKNAILPVKKTIVKEISRTIIKDSSDALIINILEGAVDNLPAANKAIGFIKILGKDLHRDLIKGSDVELTFEVSESRDLKVEVYLTLSGQEYENVFNPSETHIDLENMKMDLESFRINLLKKQNEVAASEDYGQAALMRDLIEEIELLKNRIAHLNVDDVTDEKYQIDEARRTIAQKVHRIFNRSVLQKTFEKYYQARDNVRSAITYGQSTDEDQRRLDQIIQSEKTYLASDNVGLINMKITQLEGLNRAINSRKEVTPADIVNHFSWLKIMDYKDKNEANTLIKKGEKALDKGSHTALLDVVNQLYMLKKREEDNDPDSFKKTGTGLK